MDNTVEYKRFVTGEMKGIELLNFEMNLIEVE